MSATTPRDGFERALAEAVAEVEGGSAAELVVLLARRSGTYPEAILLGGLTGLYAVFAALMFSEAELGDYLIFTAPLVGLLAGVLAVGLVPPLRRLLASRAAIARNVELVARATFQKAGLGATRDATALLVYLSLLERQAFVVADRGVARALGEAALVDLRLRYAAALRARDPRRAIVEATRALAAPLRAALPARPDDVNELPDLIDVVF